jgi:hypothetical protein
LDVGRSRFHPPVKQTTARTFLLVSTIFFVCGGALGLLPALTSFFLFDAPGSEKNPATILLFWSALTFPLVCVLSLAAAWILYARKHFAVACWVSLLPLVNLCGGAGALLWLQLFNNGQFS